MKDVAKQTYCQRNTKEKNTKKYGVNVPICVMFTVCKGKVEQGIETNYFIHFLYFYF